MDTILFLRRKEWEHAFLERDRVSYIFSDIVTKIIR